MPVEYAHPDGTLRRAGTGATGTTWQAAPPSGVQPARANTGRVGIGSPALTSYPANTTITNSTGVTLTNREILGDLTIQGGTNVHIVGCRITGLLKFKAYASNVSVIDSDVGALNFEWINTFTAARNYITGVPGVDGLQISSIGTGTTGRAMNGTITGNYIGNPIVSASDHYDGMQVMGSTAMTFTGNFFDMGPTLVDGMNVAVFFQDMHGGSHDVLFDGNWVRAQGNFDITSAGSNIRYRNNVIYDNPRRINLFYPSPRVATEWVNNTNQNGIPLFVTS